MRYLIFKFKIKKLNLRFFISYKIKINLNLTPQIFFCHACLKSIHQILNCITLFIAGDNMNVFLNENWRELLNELQPAIEEVFGSAFKEIGQNFLNRIPENQVLLD